MADLKAQIEISADASGVETGVTSAKRSLAGLGQAASDAGKQAAEGLENIGQGGDASAKKVDQATKSLIGSIQRTTAAMEAGTKSSAEYYRVLAEQRGVDPATLKPYLDQLEAVQAKQKQVTQSLGGTEEGMHKLNFATVGARRELVVLAHEASQGNWSKFGGSLLVLGERTDALGAAFSVTGIAIAAVVAAVAGLGVAMAMGAHESAEYAKALILSGNAAGTTVSRLQEMARSVATTTGATQGAAAEALTALVNGGGVAARNLERFGAVAVKVQRETGVAVSETAKQFAELAKDPLGASIKLTEQTHYLTVSVYEQIKALTDQGRAAAAAEAAQSAYATAMTTRVAQLEGNLGTLEKAWRGVKDTAKEAWDSMLGLGRSQTLSQQLSSAQQELQNRQQRGPMNDAPGMAEAYQKGN